MSAEHGVRIRAYGESPPVVVRQPQAPPTDLLPQKAILFNEIAERFTLPAIQPADNGEEQQLEDRNVDHERELISQSENTVRQAKIVEWDTTRVFAHDAVNRRRYRGGAWIRRCSSGWRRSITGSTNRGRSTKISDPCSRSAPRVIFGLREATFKASTRWIFEDERG
jgi:hypothetical protein